MTLPFMQFLEEHTGHMFDADASFVSARSIEREYSDRPTNDRRASFADWLGLDAHFGSPTVCAIHSALGRASTNTSAEKEAGLVHDDAVHPLLGMMFALQISPWFAVYVLSRYNSFLRAGAPINAPNQAQNNAHVNGLRAEIDRLTRANVALRDQLATADSARDQLAIELETQMRPRPSILSRICRRLRGCTL